jgi:hypothetical protein
LSQKGSPSGRRVAAGIEVSGIGLWMELSVEVGSMPGKGSSARAAAVLGVPVVRSTGPACSDLPWQEASPRANKTVITKIREILPIG